MFKKFCTIFGKKIGTSDFILDAIYEEYKIPVLHEPKSVFLNNKSSYRFVV